jgi:hypothetical protein
MQRLFTPHVPAVLLLLLLAVVAPLPASAAKIVSTTVTGSQLTINGSGFIGNLRVVLNNISLSILNSSPTQIVASLTPLPPPGTYSVIVRAGVISTSGWVTVSAPPVAYNADGTQQAGVHVVSGTVFTSDQTGQAVVTLSGPAVFTSGASYICALAYTNSLASATFDAIVNPTAGTSFTIQAAADQYVNYICLGN